MARETAQSYQERLNRVLVYIHTHLDEPLTLDELAGVAHFSPYHFHRIFTGMVGESVKGYVRRLRLERAAELLRYTARPVAELALDAGYESQAAFTRAFQAMFRLAPGAYRKALGARPGHARSPSPYTPFPAGAANHKESAMQAKIEQIEAMRVAYVRHVGPYMNCGPAWEKLCAWAMPKGLIGADTRFIGISWDDPDVTPPDRIRYDACLTVPDSVGPEGEVGVQEVRGGAYAVAEHKGPYEGLFDAYLELCGRWLPEHGYEIAQAPGFEVYVNDPETTPPEELITIIHVPVESA